MRILVTGAAGAVGSYVPQVFADDELVLTDIRGDLRTLDMRDPPPSPPRLPTSSRTSSSTSPRRPTSTSASATTTSPSRRTPSARRTSRSPAANADVELVYISTAGVFWGDKPEPYTEFDDPRPANVYGHSKLCGRARGGEHLEPLLHRPRRLDGRRRRPRQEVRGHDRRADPRAAGRSLRAVDDKLGSPTYAPDLLRVVKRLLGTGYHGLYHGVNAGWCTRYDVALELRSILGGPDVEIEPVSSAHFPLPAPRARSEAMRNYKLELLGLDEGRGLAGGAARVRRSASSRRRSLSSAPPAPSRTALTPTARRPSASD